MKQKMRQSGINVMQKKLGNVCEKSRQFSGFSSLRTGLKDTRLWFNGRTVWRFLPWQQVVTGLQDHVSSSLNLTLLTWRIWWAP